jgi:hypothetical protein
MGAVHEAAADRERRAVHGLDAEPSESDAGARDVDDGIHRPTS